MSNKKAKKSLLKWIFQLGNDKGNFQKHKFIIIFGFKIYLDTFKFKPRSKLKNEYYTYLENNLNRDKSDFVNITNAPYKTDSIITTGGGGVAIIPNSSPIISHNFTRFCEMI